MIYVDSDASEVGWQISATVAFVVATSVAGLLFGWRFLRSEKLLPIIIVITVVLAILQFAGFPHPLLNWYARFYAGVCLVVPLMVLFQSWTSQR
ncbi:MAG: hypothetical protein OES38_12980 [Gammaproteobacteria bacterium]|nr:hypothetical protein [Gammaproteobacteria bacterium]